MGYGNGFRRRESDRRGRAAFVITILGLTFVLLMAASKALAQKEPTKPRPRIGLALSGGSATGLAQIGVLEWFEAHHIPVDYIAGTSMGALVGGFYAMG